MEWIAAVAIVSFVGYFLLQPKPKPQISSKPSAITAPMCEEGAPIPVVFGTVALREPNVVWWGDMRVIRPNGYPIRYHLSIHMALCHGALDSVQQVFAGEKPLIVEPLTESQACYIDKYYAFGGPKEGGGIVGNCYFDFGELCQVNGPNAGVEGLAAESNGEDDGKGPGYYGIAHVEMRDIQVGTNPQINPFAYVVQRIMRADCGQRDQWMPQIAAIGHGCTAERSWAICGGEDTAQPSGTDIDALRVWLADHMPDDDDYTTKGTEGPWMMPAGSEGVSVPAGLPSPITPWDESAHMWFKQTVNIDRENTGQPLYLYVNCNRHAHVWIDGYYQGHNDPDVDGGAVNLPFVGAPVYADQQYKKVGAAGKHIVQIYAVDPEDSEEGHFIYARVVTTPVLANQIDAATLYNRKDMNPAHIIRECLTDKIWGCRQPTGKIGASFYETAKTLYAEGLGASLVWSKQTTMEEFIKRVLDLINGNLIQDRYTGQWELTLVRDDYKVEDLLVLDDDWIVSVESVERRTLGNLTSQVVVNYTSSILGDTASVNAMDSGLIQAQGGITSETRDYVGITTHALASRIAVRDLKVLSTPSDTCTFVAGRRAARLQPGKAFVLHKPSHGLVNKVMRVASVELGNGRTHAVRIKCVSDVFTAGDYILSEPEGSPQSDPTDNPIEVTEDPVGVSPTESYKSTFVVARMSDKALKPAVDCIFNNGAGCGIGIFDAMGWTQIHPGEWEAPGVGSSYLASAYFDGNEPYVGMRFAVFTPYALPAGQWKYSGIYEVVDRGFSIIQGQFTESRARVRRTVDMDTTSDLAHGCVFRVRAGNTLGGKWLRLTNALGSVTLNITELTWDILDTYTPTQTVDKLINAATAQDADGIGSSLNLSATASEPSTFISFKTGEFPASSMPEGSFRFDVEACILSGEPFSNTRFECQLCKDDDPDNPTVLATRETDPIRSTVPVVVSGLTSTTAAQDMLGEGLVYRLRLLTDNTDQTVVTLSWGGSKYPTRVYTPLNVLSGLVYDVTQAALGAFGPTSPRQSLLISKRVSLDGYATVEMDSQDFCTAPIALYQFWRGASTSLLDISGNGHNLAKVAGTETYTEIANTSGLGLSLNGSTYYRCEDTGGVLQSTGDRSVAIVFSLTALPSSGKWGVLFTVNDDDNSEAHDNAATNVSFELTIYSDGKLRSYYESEPSEDVDFILPDFTVEVGKLYHLCLTRKGLDESVYINGVLVASTTKATAPFGGQDARLYVGGFTPASPSWWEPLKGTIASIAFFNSALAAFEVSSLYRDEIFRWGTRGGGGGAPIAHAASHAPGGSDALTVDAAANTGSLRTLGTGSAQACAGNDSRLSNARTPTTHAASHAAGQSDAIVVTEAQLSLSNVATGNADATKHGLLGKLSGNATDYVGGDNQCHVLPAASYSGLATDYIGGDNQSHPLPSAASALVTAYSVNFANLAAADLKTGGDGTKTIDGKPWTLVNSGNAQTVYLNNGTQAGLYVRCSTANTDCWNTTYNAPRFVVGLSDLSGIKARITSEMWVMVMFSQPHVPNANYEFTRIGIQQLPALPDTAGTYKRLTIARGYNASLLCLGEFTVGGASSNAPATSQAPATSDDVYAFRILDNHIVEFYTGASSGGNFPALTDLNFGGSVSFRSAVSGWDVPSILNAQSRAFQWGLVWATATVNTLGLSDALFKKLEIRYKP